MTYCDLVNITKFSFLLSVTPEIAEARNVTAYQDVVSPDSHSEFSTPEEL